ncbi:hypothetical protein DDI_1880 [Dickeya dianthicola RNS04.9]|nr:hypothetical protein DDI_1880 [Dickeya dianthicola RNS04.9]
MFSPHRTQAETIQIAAKNSKHHTVISPRAFLLRHETSP